MLRSCVTAKTMQRGPNGQKMATSERSDVGLIALLFSTAVVAAA